MESNWLEYGLATQKLIIWLIIKYPVYYTFSVNQSYDFFGCSLVRFFFSSSWGKHVLI